ncbi:MAG: bifunctional hydroxymethylpyrimidine kinase/phosphomethylpyrimidine kinase [Cyclobacteriaceae bacterium]
MKNLYTLAISSFAVNGTASLKTFIRILGDKVLPVPSLILNGLTNMGAVRKLEIDFKELLTSSVELALHRDVELLFYIGYLGNANQANIICEIIEKYQTKIKAIIADPVCGDHGRTYVSNEVIAEWPKLISKADIAFPNITELKILTGHDPSDQLLMDHCVEQFKSKYPKPKLVITSFAQSSDTSGIAVFDNEPFYYTHQDIPQNYGGTGDALVAQFILNHFYKLKPFHQALKEATDQTYLIIKKSFEAGSKDLLYH